ncbi:hypothetical protein GCK72_003052 [Caenorhabditis remanei]|uniref:NTF2-like domain-containing protein n=1 Tax=Caenorhabditis remanei TaxID=31234 RepID=A0A6A5HWG7_CAERE|nr:hypothetical protein GCK72_003052 [Caenorhabditis remanei]KAF1771226.1 hypothetical protein GCK72_003052 [Caenorhabditis remanei]
MKVLFLLFTICFLGSVLTGSPPEDVGKGEKLVQSVLKGIELRDKKMIGDVFEDDFVYEGCKKKYNKEESTKLVGSFSHQMASIMEKGTQIMYVGPRKFMTLISSNSLKSVFVLSENWKLLHGKTISC